MFNDLALARNLLTRSSIAKEFLGCEHSRVFIREAETFAKLVEESKRKYFEKKNDRLERESDGHGARSKSQSNALARMARMWAKDDKGATAVSIRIRRSGAPEADIIVRTPHEKSKALAEAWYQTFAIKKPIEFNAAQDFLVGLPNLTSTPSCRRSLPASSISLRMRRTLRLGQTVYRILLGVRLEKPEFRP